MADNKTVTVTFAEGQRTAVAEKKFQYDYGQTLVLEGIELPFRYEVHFSNTEYSGNSVTMIGDETGVVIPDAMFLSGSTIYAWTYLHTGEDDGETVYKITIPISKRAKLTNQEPTPVQQDTITQAIAALDAAVEQTGADVIAADASATLAQSYAEGGTGTREGEDTDNARYYKEQADQSAEDAAGSAESASGSASDASDSADAAETAQGLAEDARDLAQGYAESANADADRAEQAANNAGYMEIEIDSNGHLIYTRTDAVDVDFSLSEGHLIMESV